MERQLNFAQTLATLRQRYEVSQSQLALRAGYDHSYISRLEAETRRPTRTSIENIVTALRCTPLERDVLLAAGGFLPDEERLLSTCDPATRSLQATLEAVPPEIARTLSTSVQRMAAAFQDLAHNPPNSTVPSWPLAD